MHVNPNACGFRVEDKSTQMDFTGAFRYIINISFYLAFENYFSHRK